MNEEFLYILVCPKCRGKVEYDRPEQTLACWTWRLKFALDDGIPIMTVDEATPIEQ